MLNGPHCILGIAERLWEIEAIELTRTWTGLVNRSEPSVMPQYITSFIIASCCIIIPPSHYMEMNLELEQVDTLSQSSVKPRLSTQVRLMDPACDFKVSALSIFALVGSSDWLKKSNLNGPLNNDVGAVSK